VFRYSFGELQQSPKHKIQQVLKVRVVPTLLTLVVSSLLTLVDSSLLTLVVSSLLTLVVSSLLTLVEKGSPLLAPAPALLPAISPPPPNRGWGVPQSGSPAVSPPRPTPLCLLLQWGSRRASRAGWVSAAKISLARHLTNPTHCHVGERS
jgi:hypothetical protein